MAIAHVQTVATAAGGTNSVTRSISVGSGSNRSLVAHVMFAKASDSTCTVSSVVFNSTENFTFRARSRILLSGAHSYVVETWTLDNPSNASANVVATISVTATYGPAITVSEYTGANNGVGANVGSSTGTNNSPTVTFTTGASTSVICAGVNHREPDGAYTPGTGVTERFEGAYTSQNYLALEKAASGGSDTVNTTGSSTDVWAVSAVELKEAASGATNITPGEATQTQTSDAVTVRAISPIVPAEATQAQASDAATLKAIYTVAPTEATQSQTSDAAVIRAISPIVPAEATQAQVSDAATIKAISPITPAEATQVQSSDTAIVKAIYVIAPAEATQAQTSDAGTIGQFTPIAPAEATQAQTSDAAILKAVYPLSPAEATQSQISDAVTLTAIYPITVSEATQAQTSDAAMLTGAGEYAIAPAEAVQAQTSDTVTLAVVYPVTPAEATQAQTSDTASIAYYSPGVNITPAEATQSQTADAPSLSVVYVITVADATQAQTSDLAVLTSPVTAYPPGNRRLHSPPSRATGELAERATSVFGVRQTLEVDD